jgi:hypothetical protein
MFRNGKHQIMPATSSADDAAVAITFIAAVAIFFFLCCAAPAHASFERTGAGPESAASGEILSIANDSVFGNPAAWWGETMSHVSIWGSHPYGMQEIHEAQGSIWICNPRIGGGAGFRQLGSPAYFERDLRISTSVAPFSSRTGSHPLTLGACARVLFVGGQSFVMRTGFAGDFGLRVSIDGSTHVGVHLESLVGSTPGDPNRLLVRSAMGVSRALPAGISLLLEVARRGDRAPSVAGGAVWNAHQRLILRAGFRDEPALYAWGFSIPISSLLLSISVTEADPLGRTVRAGLGWSRFSQAHAKLADP